MLVVTSSSYENTHDVGWLVVFRINVDLAIFQPYLDLEAGDNQSLKIQVARPGIEPRSSCSASQELNHSATTAPKIPMKILGYEYKSLREWKNLKRNLNSYSAWHFKIL